MADNINFHVEFKGPQHRKWHDAGWFPTVKAAEAGRVSWLKMFPCDKTQIVEITLVRKRRVVK